MQRHSVPNILRALERSCNQMRSTWISGFFWISGVQRRPRWLKLRLQRWTELRSVHNQPQDRLQAGSWWSYLQSNRLHSKVNTRYGVKRLVNWTSNGTTSCVHVVTRIICRRNRSDQLQLKETAPPISIHTLCMSPGFLCLHPLVMCDRG